LAVIPELAVTDPDAARAMLAQVFGFVPDGGMMRLGTQAVAVVTGGAAGHGAIDHLAIAVPDVDAAAAAMIARGARRDPDVTLPPRVLCRAGGAAAVRCTAKARPLTETV
jgi:hypothetical protein